MSTTKFPTSLAQAAGRGQEAVVRRRLDDDLVGGGVDVEQRGVGRAVQVVVRVRGGGHALAARERGRSGGDDGPAGLALADGGVELGGRDRAVADVRARFVASGLAARDKEMKRPSSSSTSSRPTPPAPRSSSPTASSAAPTSARRTRTAPMPTIWPCCASSAPSIGRAGPAPNCGATRKATPSHGSSSPTTSCSSARAGTTTTR